MSPIDRHRHSRTHGWNRLRASEPGRPTSDGGSYNEQRTDLSHYVLPLFDGLNPLSQLLRPLSRPGNVAVLSVRRRKTRAGIAASNRTLASISCWFRCFGQTGSCFEQCNEPIERCQSCDVALHLWRDLRQPSIGFSVVLVGGCRSSVSEPNCESVPGDISTSICICTYSCEHIHRRVSAECKAQLTHQPFDGLVRSKPRNAVFSGDVCRSRPLSVSLALRLSPELSLNEPPERLWFARNHCSSHCRQPGCESLPTDSLAIAAVAESSATAAPLVI